MLIVAHCAYDYKNPITKIVFYPGKNGTSNPFGSYKVSKIYVKSQYKKAIKNDDEVNAEKYDYAILKLAKGMDSTGGQSGSPIYKTNNGKYYVIGIHTRGLSSRNIGRYIDKDVYNFINKYK